MKRWFLVPLLSTSLLVPAHADDLNTRAATVKSQLQTQWLPAWAKRTTANENASDAAQTLQLLSKAHRLGYSTTDTNLLEAARAHYKLLRDSRRDKINEGFVEQGADLKLPTKSTLLQAMAVSGLVEFAKASSDAEPRGIAIKVWRLIRDRGRDKISGGYYDTIVSVSETPTSATSYGSKTAATHLALLEAGTALYELTHDRSIKTDLLELLDLNQGRFFPAHIVEASNSYNSIWEPDAPLKSPSTTLWNEAGVAIARTQLALGLPVNWVDFVHRVDDTQPQGDVAEEAANLDALTLLVPISSSRDARATQIDALLDNPATNVSLSTVNGGEAALDFVQTFGK